ncbi:MAG: YigZ family protein, partial [Bacteroidaceae bacterium]|nr:YigZ family protein [Bacteroidaceae bacterium]
EEEVKNIVAAYRKRFFDARHVCYAYCLDYDGMKTRANDDGEPSGSAGQPILRQLRSFGVTFTLVVVVRYYGGINLGTGGLVVAYKTATTEALNAATIEERYIKHDAIMSIPYEDVDKIMKVLREYDAEILERNYTATETILNVRYRISNEEPMLEKIEKLRLDVTVDVKN